MWSRQVPDENIESVWEAAKECREARPAFLEIGTYRYREHVGPDYDWDLGYRTKAEGMEHMARDPLPVVRSKLSEEEAARIEEESHRSVIAAFDAADSAPWPEAVFE